MDIIERANWFLHDQRGEWNDLGVPILREAVEEIERLLAFLGNMALDKIDHKRRPVLHASDCAVHNAPALPVGPCDCEAMMWHRDFPTDVREMWDILAKALMMREGGSVSITGDEIRAAAEIQAEVKFHNGGVVFRIERQ